MLNEKSFNQALKIIAGTGEKFATSVHEAGVFAIAQANEHGNVGFGVRLIEAMGKKHDRQRVVNWLMKYGKFGVSKGILVYRARKDIDGTNLEAWLDKAVACPYWELTPEKKLVERIDYLALVKSIVGKHAKLAEKEASGMQVEESNVQVLAELEAILTRHIIVETPKKPVGGHLGGELVTA